jgi:hypothetical protein
MMRPETKPQTGMHTMADNPPPTPPAAGPFAVWSKDQCRGARWLCLGRFTSQDAARRFLMTAMDRCPGCHWRVGREKPKLRPAKADTTP